MTIDPEDLVWIRPGEAQAYKLTVTNFGTALAKNVRLRVYAGLTPGEGSQHQVTSADKRSTPLNVEYGTGFDCTLGDLKPDDSTTVMVEFRPDDLGRPDTTVKAFSWKARYQDGTEERIQKGAPGLWQYRPDWR